MTHRRRRRVVNESVGQTRPNPHSKETEPGGERKNCTACDARTHGAAASEHGAKTHQNGANNVTRHGEATTETLELQVAPNPGAK